MDDLARSKHTQDSKETLGKVILSNVLSLLKIVLVCFILVYFVFNYVVHPMRVNGGSMLPTLKGGEFILSNAFSGHFGEIDYGDIVSAYSADLHQDVIKRVIALPGDTVYAKDEQVYVNGLAIEEPYLDNDFAQNILYANEVFTKDFDKVTLGEDEYWLMGDNRYVSIDSVQLGPFKRSDIIGKGAVVFLPFGKMRVTE
ncbi:MAG: signal peptidase I [Longicatena sp.]